MSTREEVPPVAPRVLIVDDDPATRQDLAKHLAGIGCDTREAEDGERALEKLAAGPVDLILLDGAMPVLDGPATLSRLRSSGDKTPVLFMLGTETKRSVVVEAMRLGIRDCLFKPCEAAELRAKALAALKRRAPPEAVADHVLPSRVEAPASAEPGPGQKAPRPVDILLIDDMENVAKRLRALLPIHVTVAAHRSAQAALGSAREQACRVIMIDYDLPDVDSAVMVSQLRMLQPHAAFIALCLRTSNDAQAEARKRGFGGVLFKPFTQQSVDDLVLQHFDEQELLVCADDLLRVAWGTDTAECLERYFGRLGTLLPPAIAKVASACFEDVILDLGEAPLSPDRVVKLLVAVSDTIRALGLRLKLVASPEVQRLIASFEETRDLPVFATPAEARAIKGATAATAASASEG